MNEARETVVDRSGDGTLDEADHDGASPGTGFPAEHLTPVSSLTLAGLPGKTPSNESQDAAVFPLAHVRALSVVPSATAVTAARVEDPRAQRSAGQCVVPLGWTFEGDLEAAGDLTVSGVFKGNILLPSVEATLHVCERGVLQGQATGGNVKVDGTVDGQIDAIGARVDISPNATVRGKVSYSQMQMANGRLDAQLQWVEAPGQAAD